MANARLTLKARTFVLTNVCAFCAVASVPGHAAKARIEWISLYNGNEANFNSIDRQRLLAALKGLGVEHVVGAGDREILVNAQNRALIQDLLMRVMAQQGVR